MKKRIICLLLSIILCFATTANVFALVVEYTEGPRLYKVDFNKATVMKNAYVNDEGRLVMSKGGYVEYDFYVPFEYATAALLYDVTEKVNVTFI